MIIKRIVQFWIIVLMVALITTSYCSDGEKRILFISSYSPSFVTYEDQVKGIKSVLGEGNTVDIEYMDSKKFYTDENVSNFYDSIKYKLENQNKYDGIIVGDDNGLNFLMEYQDELFDQIPIVFLGVNDLVNAKMASDKPMITGVVESASYSDTIEIAMKINPLAKEIVVISDNTVSGQSDLKRIKDVVKKMGVDTRILDTTYFTFDELVREIKKLDDSSILLLGSLYSDSKGERISFNEGLELIVNNSKIPLYHPYHHGIGQGVLGGKVISHYEQGKEAAELLKRVFLGEKISRIHYIHKSPNKYVFDYHVMNKFGVSMDLLPEDTELINYEVSPIVKYYKYVIAVFLVVAVEMFIIILLRITLEKNKKAERELVDSNNNLRIANEDLIAANEELTATFEELETQNRKIHQLIYVDRLTGLSNRYAIFQEIDDCMKEIDNNEIIGLMFLDVDNFKDVNDTFGHDVGDEIIRKTGMKLEKIQGENIKIGRFGGDEFLIVIGGSSRDEIVSVIDEIKGVFSNEITINDTKIYLTVSIGVSFCPDHGTTREDLIKKADLALYKAKESGKNTYVIFEDEMDKINKEDILLQGEINQAIRNKEFYLNYQPVIRTKDKKLIGFEALIRWKSERYGQVSPYLLIEKIERMGVMFEVGKWVFEEACKFIDKINNMYDTKYIISVNISILQLMNPDFYNMVIEAVDKVGVKASNICLEVTETSLLESFKEVNETILKLKDVGFIIALDDFGSGYSSLKYLKEIPIDVLKIDKYFVDDILFSDYSRSIVSSMVNISHTKGIDALAEGIEEIEQFEVLKAEGCDLIQGYLFSKPLSEEGIIDFIKNR